MSLMDDNHNKQIDELVKLYKINCIIETGTHMGDTTEKLAITYPDIEIHTVEVKNESYTIASARLSKFKNVTCHLGSSDVVLETLIPTLLNKKIFLYLDAHWWEYWPLKNELLVISKYLYNNSIIIVDDISIPNALPPGMYGYYDITNPKNVDLTYDNIKNEVDKCFETYITYYNKPIENNSGKLFCIPTTWFNTLANEDKSYINKDIYYKY
jgi:predicted O-methyltransferase YrrM